MLCHVAGRIANSVPSSYDIQAVRPSVPDDGHHPRPRRHLRRRSAQLPGQRHSTEIFPFSCTEAAPVGPLLSCSEHLDLRGFCIVFLLPLSVRLVAQGQTPHALRASILKVAAAADGRSAASLTGNCSSGGRPIPIAALPTPQTALHQQRTLTTHRLFP